MRTRFARVSLLTKILFFTSCSVTVLFAITAAPGPGNIDGNQLSQWRQYPLKSVSRIVSETKEAQPARERFEQHIAGPTTILLLWLAAMCGAVAPTCLPARRIVPRTERVCGPGGLSESILHDLRNPLSAIYTAAEMLVDADLSPAHTRRLAGNIFRASQRMEELLQDLLKVSRGERIAPEPSCLREIAVAACESLSAMADSFGTTLAVDIQSGIELPLERGRMERAFVNLIGNAIEAMPEGGDVRIWAQFVADSVVVHVDDTGPGVIPEIRSRLFQPYATAGKRNGLGLGLAFSRQTILEHGGDLWAGSAPGGGARFSLRLPAAQVVQSQAVAV